MIGEMKWNEWDSHKNLYGVFDTISQFFPPFSSMLTYLSLWHLFKMIIYKIIIH